MVTIFISGHSCIPLQQRRPSNRLPVPCRARVRAVPCRAEIVSVPCRAELVVPCCTVSQVVGLVSAWSCPSQSPKQPLTLVRAHSVDIHGPYPQASCRSCLAPPPLPRRTTSRPPPGRHAYYGFQTVCKCPFWALLVTLVTGSNQTWAN